MVRISKIYTRTGDDGSTALLGNERVPKDSLRVSAYGDIDELNAHLGIVRVQMSIDALPELERKVELLQQRLFDLGALLATPSQMSHPSLPRLAPETVDEMERWIDALIEPLPVLTSFVLPGGSELNARLHVARTVCRRAERSVLSLHRSEGVDAVILKFINRLSDLLFAMARYTAHVQQSPEYLWVPGKS